MVELPFNTPYGSNYGFHQQIPIGGVENLLFTRSTLYLWFIIGFILWFKWRSPEMDFSLLIIHFHRIFHEINQSFWRTAIYGTPRYVPLQ